MPFCLFLSLLLMCPEKKEKNRGRKKKKKKSERSCSQTTALKTKFSNIRSIQCEIKIRISFIKMKCQHTESTVKSKFVLRLSR